MLEKIFRKKEQRKASKTIKEYEIDEAELLKKLGVKEKEISHLVHDSCGRTVKIVTKEEK